MNINYNGKEFKLDPNNWDEEWEEMLNMVCVCGHKLKDHSFTHGYGTMNRFITSNCVLCKTHKVDSKHPQGFVCAQFRIEPAPNDARWSNFPGLQQ